MAKYIFSIIFLFFSLTLSGKVKKISLLDYKSYEYCSHGEDGVLREIFRRLGIKKGTFLQIGNTIDYKSSPVRLLQENGWDGHIVEYDLKHLRKLYNQFCKDYSVTIYPHYLALDETVESDLSLKSLARSYFPDCAIDFLYIKTFGTETWILDLLERHPKVICIHGGIIWNPQNRVKVPMKVSRENLQQPLSVIIRAAKEKGYRPVCFTTHLFLVRKGYKNLFKDVESDCEMLWQNAWDVALKEQERNSFLEERRTNSLIHQYEDERYFNLP
jgi:hypothetical protein